LVEQLTQQLAEARAANEKLRRRVEALEVVAEASPITDEIINKIKAAKGGDRE
jgi:cell division protein FtsB